ncbi:MULTISPECIES: HP0495 family protein [Cupriavidus]|uniref:HP0495 family protein n=1 Tax=Cupriavidus TaxID=106589 RepID=UPI000380E365|nr:MULTISPECIES: YbeD family protein [Cupriavidus]
MSTDDPKGRPGDIPPSESLIEYPSHFPIKVMGSMQDGFAEAIVTLVQEFDADFHAGKLEMRPSRNGNYLGLTITVWVTSREQLDDLYRALTSHPMVKIVL